MNQIPSYVPGTCNIGPAEIALRQRSGWAGGVVTVIMLALFLTGDQAPWWRLLLFFPAAATAIGFLQARFHFCVAYGFSGFYNVLKPVGATETIQQSEFRRADRIKGLNILGYASLIGAAVSLIALFL